MKEVVVGILPFVDCSLVCCLCNAFIDYDNKAYGCKFNDSDYTEHFDRMTPLFCPAVPVLVCENKNMVSYTKFVVDLDKLEGK